MKRSTSDRIAIYSILAAILGALLYYGLTVNRVSDAWMQESIKANVRLVEINKSQADCVAGYEAGWKRDRKQPTEAQRANITRQCRETAELTYDHLHRDH